MVTSFPVLGLDTSAGACACIVMPDGQSFSASMAQPRAHSRELLPMLQQLMQQADLQWTDIGAFAVAVGPGSFTGLRVACATIAGINASLQKPVYDVCSLSITARQAAHNTSFWAIEDARSQLVYAAQFEHGQCIQAAQCMPWQDFLALPASAYVSVSDVPIALPNWQVLSIQTTRKDALLASIQALSLNDECHALWVEPVYLQASQAEKNIA